MQCSCKVCDYGKDVLKHLDLLPEDLRPFFEGLHDRLINAEDEVDYMSRILDGSWPTAEYILTKALKKIEGKMDDQ